jgi:hypothetical protein
MKMNVHEFRASLTGDRPPEGISAPMEALWWDAKGDWARAHGLVDELETREGMAVHAYLHRKEGAASNAEYWYARAGRRSNRPTLEGEWAALVEGLEAGG